MKSHSQRHELSILGLGALVLGLAIIGGYVYLDTHTHDAIKPTETEAPLKQTRDHDSVPASKQAVRTKQRQAQPAAQKTVSDGMHARQQADTEIPREQAAVGREIVGVPVRLVAETDPGSTLKEVTANYAKYASSSITLKAPLTAENGEVVPLSAEIPNALAGNFWIYALENAQPFLGRLEYHRSCRPCVISTRIRMERSGEILVIHQDGNGNLIARKTNVKIGVPGFPKVSGVSLRSHSVKASQKWDGERVDVRVLAGSDMALDGYLKEVNITVDGQPLATWHLTPGFSKDPLLGVSYELPQRKVYVELMSNDGLSVSTEIN